MPAAAAPGIERAKTELTGKSLVAHTASVDIEAMAESTILQGVPLPMRHSAYRVGAVLSAYFDSSSSLVKCALDEAHTFKRGRGQWLTIEVTSAAQVQGLLRSESLNVAMLAPVLAYSDMVAGVTWHDFSTTQTRIPHPCCTGKSRSS